MKTVIKIKFFFLTLFFSVVLTGCKENNSDIGFSIQPEGEILEIKVTDTVTINAYSVLVDSLVSSKTTHAIIGSNYDPIFGITTASTYLTFSVSDKQINYDFGNDAVLDSLVLMLQYHSFTGDTTTALNIHAYELLDKIYKDSVYYMSNTINHNAGVDYIKNNVFLPRPHTKVKMGSDTISYPSHLRLKLSDELGRLFLEKGVAGLNEPENFANIFKGMLLTTDNIEANGKGSLTSFSLQTDYTKLRLYYHNKKDTLYFDYVVNEKAPRFNHFNHFNYDQASQLLKNQIIDKDTLLGKQNLYLQGMGGVRTVVKFPNLPLSKKMVIHEAKLVIPVDKSDINQYKSPRFISLMEQKEDGSIRNVEDFIKPTDKESFGGKYFSDEGKYEFKLDHYVQNIITGKKEVYPLLLMIPYEAISERRIKIYGPENEEKKMYLKIIYTEVED